jgi:hypothetical protein
MEGRGKMPGALNSPLPLENPLNALSSGMTAELQALLHEDERTSLFIFVQDSPSMFFQQSLSFLVLISPSDPGIVSSALVGETSSPTLVWRVPA